MDRTIATLKSSQKNLLTPTKIKINKLDEILDKLPGSIYWKDKDGVYLGRNQFSLIKSQYFGYEKQSSTKEAVVGKTDYDFIPKADADLFRNNDLLVMQDKQEIIKEESVLLQNGKTIIQISNKRPLYDRNNCIIGIIGNTLDITGLTHSQTKINYLTSVTKKSLIIENIKLTKRESDCVKLCVRGKTAKGISRILGISNRTVEYYLENVKNKLNVSSKNDLIDKVFDYLF